MSDVHVRLLSLPSYKVKEAVTENEDGSYTVIVNARIASNQQRKALRHALLHIRRCDLQGGDIQRIESEAHENAF